MAYAVGRSVGNAVERNRLRRRLRAAVREHADRLAPDRAYLLSAGPRATAMTHAQLSAAVAQLLEPEAAS